MKTGNIIKFNIILLTICSIILAEGEQQFAELGEFKLEKGGTIQNCKIGYRCFGKLNQDSTNVILFPTWFGGTSGHLANLIDNYKLVNKDSYYIIAVDALGNGISSSPSNSAKQSGENFPAVTIRDMVHTQYKLLTEKMGFEHIFAIVGGSMGSFQTFEWLVTYPDFMNRALPYVCTPKLTPPDKLWMKLQLEIVYSALDSGCSKAQTQKILDIYSRMTGRTPEFFYQNMSDREFEEFYNQFEPRLDERFTFYNRACQIKAMLNFDITRHFDNSLKEAASAIKADLFMIVSETDQLVNPGLSKKLANISNAKILVLQNNCGHLGVGCEIEKCTHAIAEFLEN
jgi:homoserine O-acetyltransferase